MATAAENIIAQYPYKSSGDGFYAGGGDDFIEILLDQGWKFVWSEANYHWCMVHGDDRSEITYVEGDLYLGNRN